MRTPGQGSKYPFTLRDANGEFLNGANNYKLYLPPDTGLTCVNFRPLVGIAKSSGLFRYPMNRPP
jgi:hypothetical protein